MTHVISVFIVIMGICMSACAQRHDSFNDMDVDQFAHFITADGVQLLDVRTPEEFAEGHIKGAGNIDIFDEDFLVDASRELVKDRPVAVYCRSGKRSADAAGKLAAEGYEVTNLRGGILAWTASGKPVEK